MDILSKHHHTHPYGYPAQTPSHTDIWISSTDNHTDIQISRTDTHIPHSHHHLIETNGYPAQTLTQTDEYHAQTQSHIDIRISRRDTITHTYGRKPCQKDVHLHPDCLIQSRAQIRFFEAGSAEISCDNLLKTPFSA